GRVEPCARAGGVRKRDRDDAVEVETAPDALSKPGSSENPLDREPAHGDEEPRAQQLELPLPPEGAELLLAGRGRPVAAAARGPPRIAAGDRGAVEGRVELLLVETEPASQRLAGAAAPG